MVKKLLYYVEKTKCKTYFRITGQFDTKTIINLLGIKPEESWDIGDVRVGGKSHYEFASCKFNTCAEYDFVVSNQMEKTLQPLFDKVEVLKQIKNNYDVSYGLIVVPYVRYDESSPCLAPSKKVMQFCIDTDTEIDIDLYVGCPDDEEDGIPII